MIRKILFTLSLGLLFGILPTLCNAQLNVSDVFSISNIMRPDSITVKPDSMKLSVHFKINNLSDAAKIYVKVGLSQDAGELINDQYQMISQGGIYYISNNFMQFQFYGNSAVCHYPILISQAQTIKWITVYAEDKQGTITDKVYFNYQ